MTAMWIVLGVIVYFAGFVLVGGYQERHCKRKDAGHRYRDWEYSGWTDCGHPWNTPLPLLWPAALALAVFVSPAWFFFGGASKLSHKVAQLPTREERVAEKEKQLRKLEQERNIERKASKKRVAQLEEELLGLKRSHEAAQ